MDFRLRHTAMASKRWNPSMGMAIKVVDRQTPRLDNITLGREELNGKGVPEGNPYGVHTPRVMRGPGGLYPAADAPKRATDKQQGATDGAI